VSSEGLDLAAPQSAGVGTGPRLISWLDWLRYGPFLAQVIVTRRCNLRCGYCTEYDKTSDPVSFDVLRRRLELLRDLRTWAVSLMGGEPTLHPDLLRIFSTMRVLGFHRRMMTTNGLRLTKEIVDGLNNSGMTDMSLSIDGVKRNATTVKVLNVLRRKLDILAERAKFDVVVSAVVGTAPREEVLEVVEFAKSRGFTPRLLVLHNEHGQMGLSAEELAVYAEVKRLFGRRVTKEAHRYREHLIQNGEAPFRCRAGARYLYIDEFGMVRWCAQTRMAFGKSLSAYALEDLRQHFYAEKACSDKCSVGCVRTASAFDEWRSQRGVSDVPRTATMAS
jgi:MoaA/NifB/PqqE/SkfB family radical SAM enzyme